MEVIPPTPTIRRRGPDKSIRKKRGERPTPADIESVAEMKAAGASNMSISRDTRMSVNLVEQILRHPDTQAYMAKCREAIRSMALDKLVEVQRKAMEWIDTVAESKLEPKTFDALARGLGNLERMASSASGENKPQINVTNQTLNVDVDMELDQLKKFLQAI